MERLMSFFVKYISMASLPRVRWTDIVEILIISFLFYEIMLWIKNTKAWSLMRGIVVIMLFVIVAYIFQMNTIIWLVKNASVVAITALIVIFQPELRKALEMLGRQNFFAGFLSLDSSRNFDASFSQKTISEIVKACYEMGKVKTGALIVVARQTLLTEYERTGIDLDSLVSSQLLINIFEHNTPLHDGAVIIRGNRVVSATCYLPLSENMALSKELGTRHRAGVGISEVTDSITIIVSEETGRVSVAIGGELFRNVNADFLKEKLSLALNKTSEEKKRFPWKGKVKSEE